MKLTAAILLCGLTMTVASAWTPWLEQWGPLLALWTAGGTHLAWIVAREAKNARPPQAEEHRAA
jgi:hypothetical protein